MCLLRKKLLALVSKESWGRAGAKAGPRGWKAEGSWLYSHAGSACPVAQGSGVSDLLLLLFLLQECTNIFSKGGGEELARHAGVPFLGEWPLEQRAFRGWK